MKQDITLANYITRTMAKLESEKNQYSPNKEDNRYLVYPEKRGEESDEKINPFSEV